MKTTNIYIIVLTLLLSVSVQAQTTSTSSGNEAYKGIENTLLDFKDDVIETVSDVKDKADDVLDDIKDGLEAIAYLEKFMRGDIQLLMLSENETIEKYEKIFNQGKHQGIYYRIYESEESLYVAFDWDNRAQIMVGETSGGGMDFGTYEEEGEKGEDGEYDKDLHPLFVKIPKDKIVQFTDKEGYWYVPLEAESGNTTFIKFNAKQRAVSVLQELLDLSLNDKVEKIEKWLFEVILNTSIDINMIGMELFGNSEIDYATTLLNLLKNFDENNKELQEEIRETIKKLLSKELEAIGGFPIFIHWAFIYSPEVIKKHYGNKVSETTFDCDGFSNACTKLTITSGKEKGKLMLFDRYGRLVFIDTKGEGTALFQYDRDITVNLPPAYTMQDIMSGKVVIPD